MLGKITVVVTLFSFTLGFPCATLALDSTRSGTAASRKDTIQNRLTSFREKAASREAIFKSKLLTFKDKRKAEIAERVNNYLNQINKKITDMMQKHLSYMSRILDRLDSRVNSNTPDIKDIDAAKTAILSSRNTIASASSAVTEQSLKDYTIQATSEATIRADAKLKRDQLHSDLQTTRKLVIDAKQSVANAIRVAKSGRLKEGTASGQQ